VRTADLETIQQRHHVGHVVLEHRRLAVVIVGAAEASEVGRNEPPPVRGCEQLGQPHLCRERERMQQQEHAPGRMAGLEIREAS
jgi:hypothetical protein